MAKGEVLQLVVFAFIFGTACASIGLKARPVVEFCESLSEVMFRYTGYVMYFAPLGIFGAMASTIGERGLKVLLNLGKLVATLYGAQAFFVIFVFGAVALIAKIPIRKFIRYVREPFLIAYSTASSEAALPLALENMEKLGVPKHIVAFVLPTGYSFNLDGSTLYLALAAMFVAQAANITVPFTTQLVMMLTLMLTSKGVAGCPARVARNPRRHASNLRTPRRRSRRNPRRRHFNGHVPHFGEPARQLPGDSSSRQMGRRPANRRRDAHARTRTSPSRNRQLNLTCSAGCKPAADCQIRQTKSG